MGSNNTKLKHPEEVLEESVEGRVGSESDRHSTPVGVLDDQTLVGKVDLPGCFEHSEHTSSHETHVAASEEMPSCFDGLEFGISDLREDIANFKISRFHENPRFVDFRKMPVPILQCFFWPDEWKILCVCIFLNCTRRAQVERVVWKFFEEYPTPEALLKAPDEEVQEIIKPLGFYKRRTTSLKRMSEDFIAGNWKSPEDLRSVGVYAATCYRMMLNFELGEHAPDDHALVDLYNWMKGISPRRLSYLGEITNPIRVGRLLPDVRR